MLNRRHLMAGAVALPVAARAQAQGQGGTWPGTRPIEIIVPYPPGGGIDVMARLIARALPDQLGGARVVVTNRVGAGGQTGTEAIFAARPDGYTLGAIASLALSSIPLERRARWEIGEFTYLANVVDDPGALWVHADSPLRTLDDLKRAAARGTDAVSVGSAAGIGSDDHQLLLAFEEAAGVRALHSPYNGTALVIRDLLSRQVDVASYNLSEGLSLLREGRTRCLGQAAEARWAPMSDVPTFREQGFDVIGGSARGFVAPPGLPPEIAARLVAAFRAILTAPDFVAEVERLNLPFRPVIGDDYRTMVLREAEGVRALFARRSWNHG